MFASSAYFYQGGGWNQNTRFDLVRAIVEQHTVRIDAYHDNTGDQAKVGRHFYADKAPGASLIAVPAVALVRGVAAMAGADVASKRWVVWCSYVATMAGAAAPGALAACCVFLIAVRLGATEVGASLAAVACGLGSPMWAYSTILYGHTLAAGCLMAAFAGVMAMSDEGRADESRMALAIGLAAGWSVVTEYPSAVPVILILLLAAWRLRRSSAERLWNLAGSAIVGLAISGAVLGAYSWAAFGSPFHIGYSSEPGFEKMRQGIFGVAWPQPSVLRELLFGSFRGLLPIAPALALAPIGLVMWMWRASTRAVAIAAGAVVVYYFALTAGYAYWDGGWSYGSRHLAPALPFLSLGVAPLWTRANRWWRVVIVAALAASVFQTLAAVSTTAQPSHAIERPMADFLMPSFLSGDLAVYWQSVLERDYPGEPMSQLAARGVPREAWNLGQKAGLIGHASLLPLYGLWIFGVWLWRRPPIWKRETSPA